MYVVRLFDPQAEKIVGQVAVAYRHTIGTRPDVDAGILLDQAAAGIAYDQTIDGDIPGGDVEGVALEAAAQGGAVDSLQRQGFVDLQVFPVQAALHTYFVARAGLGDGRADGLAWLHRQDVGAARACHTDQQTGQNQQCARSDR